MNTKSKVPEMISSIFTEKQDLDQEVDGCWYEKKKQIDQKILDSPNVLILAKECALQTTLIETYNQDDPNAYYKYVHCSYKDGIDMIIDALKKDQRFAVYHELIPTGRKHKFILDIEVKSKDLKGIYKSEQFFIETVITNYFAKLGVLFFAECANVVLDLHDDVLITTACGIKNGSDYLSAHIVFEPIIVHDDEYLDILSRYIVFLKRKHEFGKTGYSYPLYLFQEVDGETEFTIDTKKKFHQMRITFNDKLNSKRPLCYYDTKNNSIMKNLKITDETIGFITSTLKKGLLTYYGPKKTPYVLLRYKMSKGIKDEFDKILNKNKRKLDEYLPITDQKYKFSTPKPMSITMLDNNKQNILELIQRYYKIYCPIYDITKNTISDIKAEIAGDYTIIYISGPPCCIKYQRSKSQHSKPSKKIEFTISPTHIWQKCFSTTCQKHKRLSLKIKHSF